MGYFELEGYALVKKLGEGQYAKVYLGYKIDNKKERVAVKLMKQNLKSLLESEIEPLLDL